MTFSKKLQMGGYFHKSTARVDTGYRIFNTWMGEEVKALQLTTVLDVIERDDFSTRYVVLVMFSRLD